MTEGAGIEKEVQPGAAGAVSVTHTGSITTGSVSSSGVRFGSNAYGILAQSIGGGGGRVTSSGVGAMVGSFTGTAQGKPDAWHAGAHTRLAYQVPFGGEAGGWYVQPRADLHLNYVRSGGYTEGGATPFNLAVASEGATTFTAVPAVEVGGRTRIGEATVLRSFVSVGIELSANSDWAATTRLASQPNSHGFRAGTPIPNVLGKFTVGAELLTAANWDLRVQYSSEVGDDYTSHTGLARVAYRF